MARIAPGGRGEQRVDGDDADPQVGRAERRPGVEAHPTEGQDQRADDDVAEVVPGERPDRPVLSVLADARSEQHRQRECGPATGRMHDPGPGEVDRAVAEVERLAEVREPTTTPHPVAVDRVDDRPHRDLGEEEAREADPLGDRADDDVAGGLHEHDLEQEEREHADVVAVPRLQEEPVQADDAGVAVTEDRGQRRRTAQIGDRCNPAELKREAHGVIRHQRDDERHEVHHHHVPGVFRPCEPGDEEREPHLHEQHEEAGEQEPGEVDRDRQVTDVVRQRLHPGRGQRHLGDAQGVVGGRLGGVEHGAVALAGRPSGVRMVVELADRDQRDQRERGQQEELLASGHPDTPSSADSPRRARCRRRKRTYGGGANAGSHRGHATITEDLRFAFVNLSNPTEEFARADGNLSVVERLVVADPPVAETGLGEDETRPGGVVVELAAQVDHEDADTAPVARAGASPRPPRAAVRGSRACRGARAGPPAGGTPWA